jgi:hypothetical protein
MPKVDVDYSNTLFYKIYCKDTSISEVYIGHTTNFVQRKSCHKQSCNNSKAANHDCKLYKFIRDNGGWDNWRMDIVAHHECNDHYEARKKEQELFLFYKATLNSIEPMPRPKPSRVLANDINPIKSTHTCEVCNFSCFNTLDVFIQHLTRNKHIKAANRTTILTKYNCEKCQYTCSNLTNFNKHLRTNKHIVRCCSTNTQISWVDYNCECGHTYKHRQSFNRHKKTCLYTTEPSIDFADTHPLPPHFDAALVIELLKQNQEFSKLIIEQNKQLILLAKPIGNQPDN